MGSCGMLVSGVVDVVGVLLLWITLASAFEDQVGYVCTKKFVAIGKKCYYFSKDEAIWHDAHFNCASMNSSLAVINNPHQELLVRRYLNSRRGEGQYERWLGGRYNEKQSRWIWGVNGKPLIFQGFSRMNANDDKWAWHCIIVDPRHQNKWGARNCVEKKHYVCQKPSKKVNCRNGHSRCPKTHVGRSAPGYLVKKLPKRNNPYQVANFVCPPHMILVGRKCYFFSTDELNWSDAYWACRDNNSKLAVITTRMQDNILRGFLKANFTEQRERWIGGIFDWKQDKWKWAMSGKIIKYQHFAKPVLKEKRNNAQHCIILDPLYNHLWNSKNRLERKSYICQAKTKSVVKYDKLYSKKEVQSSALDINLVTTTNLPSFATALERNNVT